MCSPLANRTVHGWLTGLGCLLVVVAGQKVRGAEPPKGEVTLSVTASATTISVGDPLIIKGVLRNSTAKAVWLPRRFNTDSDRVQVEICPPDSKEFKRVIPLRDDLLGGGLRRAVWLEAGKEVACYPRMFGEFQTPGKWQLRLTASVDSEWITSPALTVLVTERSERAREAMAEYYSAIRSCLGRYDEAERDDLAKALEARELLGTSETARAITQAQLLRSLRTAGSARAQALALAALNKHREGLSPVWREFLDLKAADILFEQKHYDAAEALLKEIKEPSTDRDRLLAGLQSVRDEKAIPAPRPVKP